MSMHPGRGASPRCCAHVSIQITLVEFDSCFPLFITKLRRLLLAPLPGCDPLWGWTGGVGLWPQPPATGCDASGIGARLLAFRMMPRVCLNNEDGQTASAETGVARTEMQLLFEK
jgi:hypothetical protein